MKCLLNVSRPTNCLAHPARNATHYGRRIRCFLLSALAAAGVGAAGQLVNAGAGGFDATRCTAPAVACLASLSPAERQICDAGQGAITPLAFPLLFEAPAGEGLREMQFRGPARPTLVDYDLVLFA